ncbi:MAG: ATP-binding protein [Bacteroidota bacterium]
MVLDKNLKLIWFFSKTLGWNTSDKNFIDYISNKNHVLISEFLSGLSATPSVLNSPIQFLMDDKVYHYQNIHALRLADENNGHILLIMHNSILGQQEDLLFQLRDRLESANREFSDFTYVVSHDLQESVRMVSSFTELIDKEYEKILNSKGKAYIRFAREGSVKLKQMINDLLKYSRVLMDDSPFEEVSLKNIVDDFLKSKNTLIKEEAEINTAIKDYTLQAKKKQLENLVSHLLDNALKFKEEGAVAKIEIEGAVKIESYVFTVSDLGIGIPQDFLDRAFTVFQKGDNAERFEGTGMGLALAKRIVDNHNGNISIEKLDKGTRVQVILPVVHNKIYDYPDD